eukprot:scaffold81370_cov30-Tisochrysis_lutea.AAC.1
MAASSEAYGPKSVFCVDPSSPTPIFRVPCISSGRPKSMVSPDSLLLIMRARASVGHAACDTPVYIGYNSKRRRCC